MINSKFQKAKYAAYHRMVFRKFVATDTRVAAFQLRRNTDTSMRDIAKTCGISKASVQRILTGGIPRRIATGTKQMGHPRQLSVRQQHLLVRNLRKVREQNPTFSHKDLMQQVVWTMQLFLRGQWIAFFRAKVSAICRHERKACWKKRSHKARPILPCNEKSLPPVRLNKASSILLGWGSFTFKTNPQAGAKCPRARIWRQRGEGLSFGCTAKDSKEGTGRRLVKLFVAITYGEGVIRCESYEHLTGTFFAELIEKHFNSLFDKAKKHGSRLWVQDGDPLQTSKAAKSAMANCTCDASFIQIPPRSPNPNLVENFFHLVRCKLWSDSLVLNITKETLQQF